MVTGGSPPTLAIAYDPLHILKNMSLKRKKLFKILGLKQHSDTIAAYFLAVIFHGCCTAGFLPCNSWSPLTDEVCWMQLVVDHECIWLLPLLAPHGCVLSGLIARLSLTPHSNLLPVMVTSSSKVFRRFKDSGELPGVSCSQCCPQSPCAWLGAWG